VASAPGEDATAHSLRSGRAASVAREKSG
jgi:hypothetical protein